MLRLSRSPARFTLFIGSSHSVTCVMLCGGAECPAQSISSLPHSTSCTSCIGVRTQPAIGQTVCRFCLSGTFYSRTLDQCQTCKPGVICNSSGIFGDGNHYVYYNLAQDTIESIPCLNGYCEVCPKFPEDAVAYSVDPETNLTIVNPSFVPLTDGVVFSCCSANRMPPQGNNMCGDCLPGHYIWGSECVLCDKANVPVITMFVLVTWFYVSVFYRLAQISRADTRIFINFVQFVLIFLQTRAGGLVAWLSVFNFNVFQSSGGTCVAPLAPLANLATGLFIPIVGFGLLLWNAFLHWVMWNRFRTGMCDRCCWGTESAAAPFKYELAPGEQASSSFYWKRFWFELRAKTEYWPIWNTYRRTFLAFLCSSYPSIAQAVFNFFNCVDSNNDRVMQQYPSISCDHNSEYLRLLPLFVILLILVCGLPVMLFARLWWLNRRNVLFHNDEIKFVYGPMIEAYPTDLYYWENWSLVRRLTIAAVAQVVSPLDLAIKFTWITFLNVSFLFIHFMTRPYVLLMDNYFEALALVVLSLISLVLIDSGDPLTPAVAGALTGVSFFVGAILFSRIILSRYANYQRSIAPNSRGKSFAFNSLLRIDPADTARDKALSEAAARNGSAPKPQNLNAPRSSKPNVAAAVHSNPDANTTVSSAASTDLATPSTAASAAVADPAATAAPTDTPAPAPAPAPSVEPTAAEAAPAPAAASSDEPASPPPPAEIVVSPDTVSVVVEGGADAPLAPSTDDIGSSSSPAKKEH